LHAGFISRSPTSTGFADQLEHCSNTDILAIRFNLRDKATKLGCFAVGPDFELGERCEGRDGRYGIRRATTCAVISSSWKGSLGSAPDRPNQSKVRPLSGPQNIAGVMTICRKVQTYRSIHPDWINERIQLPRIPQKQFRILLGTRGLQSRRIFSACDSRADRKMPQVKGDSADYILYLQ
jgi:hypothetical protein